MDSKNILMSKTFWFNLIAMGPQLVGMVPAGYEQYVLAAVGIGNIILRLITKQPITVIK